MLTTLKNALKIKEIRKKLLYTLGMLVVIRLGSQLPVPGVNRDYFSYWFSSQSSEAFNFFDAFTGGSFENMSIFALNITPYITSSIIMQLLTIAIPKLEEMQKDGEDGRKKIASITRYVTVALALIQAAAMAIGFGRSGLLQEYNALNVITVIAALTAGSAFLMWVGERITENGIGNGISMILFANIVSGLPSTFVQFNQNLKYEETAAWLQIVLWVAVILVMVGSLVFVTYMSDAERRIPVQYAKRTVGRKQYGGQSSNLPIKLNMSGVMPIIFASTIISLPITIMQFAKVKDTNFFYKALSSDSVIYAVLLFVLIIAFAYFYISISFNPVEVSNNLMQQGGSIPGIRPGRPTALYITKVLNKIILMGALILGCIACFPLILNIVTGGLLNVIAFSGSTLLIVVGVILETVREMEAQMTMRHYKGFLD